MFQLSLSTSLTPPPTPGAGPAPVLSGAFSAALAGLVGVHGAPTEPGGATSISRQPNADGGKSLPSIDDLAVDPALAWLDGGQPSSVVISISAVEAMTDTAAQADPLDQTVESATAGSQAPSRFAPATVIGPTKSLRVKQPQKAAEMAGEDGTASLPLLPTETVPISDLPEPAIAASRHHMTATPADAADKRSDKKNDATNRTASEVGVVTAILVPPVTVAVHVPMPTPPAGVVPKRGERPTVLPGRETIARSAPPQLDATRVPPAALPQKGKPAIVVGKGGTEIGAIEGTPEQVPATPAVAATGVFATGTRPNDGNHPQTATTIASPHDRIPPVSNFSSTTSARSAATANAKPAAQSLASDVSTIPVRSTVASAPAVLPAIGTLQIVGRQDKAASRIDAPIAGTPPTHSSGQPSIAAQRPISGLVDTGPAALQPAVAPRQPLPSDAALSVAATAPAAAPQADLRSEQPRNMFAPITTRATTNDASQRADAVAPAAPAPPVPVSVPPARPAGMVFGIALGGLALDRRPLSAERPSPRDEALQALTTLAGTGPTSPIAATGGAQHGTLDMHRDDWPQAMIDRIEALRDAANATSTRITLAPDALGKVDLSIRHDGDAVHVHFAAEAAQTRAILADAQPKLAELAQARGLRLGQATVDAGAGGGGQRQPSGNAASPPPQRPTLVFTRAANDAAPDSTRLA